MLSSCLFIKTQRLLEIFGKRRTHYRRQKLIFDKGRWKEINHKMNRFGFFFSFLFIPRVLSGSVSVCTDRFKLPTNLASPMVSFQTYTRPPSLFLLLHTQSFSSSCNPRCAMIFFFLIYSTRALGQTKVLMRTARLYKHGILLSQDGYTEKLTYKLRSELSPRRVRLPTAVNWLWLKSLQITKKKKGEHQDMKKNHQSVEKRKKNI